MRGKIGEDPNSNYKKGIFVTTQIKMMFFAYILGQKKKEFLLILRDGGSTYF
jgi:hypothetical protein